MNQINPTSIETLRSTKPLIHHITNYVTVNDCANITLAIGASPVMADAIEEAAEIASVASAVVLNMGTLNANTVASMMAAGKAAGAAGIPVIFDPVGAGASQFRNNTAITLLKEVPISVLRGNISEIRFIAGLHSETKGVDASDNDLSTLADAQKVAKTVAGEFNCIVAITGATDIVSDGSKTICIENGHPMLSNLTGTGCMCSSLIGSFCGSNPSSVFDATVSALLTMGIAGELAHTKAGHKGNGSFRSALHDAVSHMTGETLTEGGNYYEA